MFHRERERERNDEFVLKSSRQHLPMGGCLLSSIMGQNDDYEDGGGEGDPFL